MKFNKNAILSQLKKNGKTFAELKFKLVKLILGFVSKNRNQFVGIFPNIFQQAVFISG